jgi:hypothetical protein
MKTKLIALLAVSALITACEKEIQMELKAKDIKLVIEGQISNNGEPATVTLTETTKFSNSNNFPTVSGATITISDNAGQSETLAESTPGTYKGSSLYGEPGRTYYLSITAKGKNYSAISIMPPVVTLDSVFGKEEAFMGGQMYNVYPIFKDPGGVKNYYRILEFINGVRKKGANNLNDILFDGTYNIEPITNRSEEVENGDRIDLEFRCIDEGVYKYFNSMASVNSGGAAPANPYSNITGGALGYFSAHTTEKKSLIVNK